MIKHYILTADCHREFSRFNNLNTNPEETAIIVLGDFSVDYYLNNNDKKRKYELCDKGFTYYIVRGNHEQRPELIDGITTIYDDIVKGNVYIHPDFPNIRYFLSWGIYTINKYKCLEIGGAYSIDKWYRLARYGIYNETDNIPKKTGWFNDEQATSDEMHNCFETVKGQQFDFVFTHTCPISFQPTDLFLNGVNQSLVDNTMEKWLEQVKDNINWKVWCFGHYHQNRLELPYVEQYFTAMEDLDVIQNRWNNYKVTGELDWWLLKSPKFEDG